MWLAGQFINPLFIYGGVGLGKTHLVHAILATICWLIARMPRFYIHAEHFRTDVSPISKTLTSSKSATTA
jgi:chromosomal replication initiator protein